MYRVPFGFFQLLFFFESSGPLEDGPGPIVSDMPCVSATEGVSQDWGQVYHGVGSYYLKLEVIT